MSTIKRLFLILFIISMPSLLLAKSRIIVSCQEDFDRMGESIKTALQKERCTIEVIIEDGVYVYKEKHIRLANIDAPKISLILKGENVRILPAGKYYKDGDDYKGLFNLHLGFITPNGQDVPIWSSLMISYQLVEVVNEEAKLCRIPCAGVKNMKEEQLNNAFIRIPRWFLSTSCKLKKIENGFVYFTAHGLAKSSLGGWNINDDFNYTHKKEIRYALCNVKVEDRAVSIVGRKIRLPKESNTVYEYNGSTFLLLSNCNFKEIKLTGLDFLAAAYYDAGMIEMRRVFTQGAIIENCHFSNMKCEVIKLKDSPNVTVKNCTFDHCYKDVINSNNGSANFAVIGCTFTDLGLDMENSAGVRCLGSHFNISNNIFKNYGYSAISTGGNARIEYTHLITGIIENNQLLFTSEYCKQKAEKTLMDGGAIYVSTKTDGVVISGNSISNFTGMADNRAIFCDDGARNVTICGNVIIGTENSYSIDSRRVASVESVAGPVNVGNRIYGNVVDSRIRFVVNEGTDNRCELGKNYFITKQGAALPENQYEKIDTTGIDVRIENQGIQGGRLIVSKSDAKIMKKSASWKTLKSRIRTR